MGISPSAIAKKLSWLNCLKGALKNELHSKSSFSVPLSFSSWEIDLIKKAIGETIQDLINSGLKTSFTKKSLILQGL